MKKQENGNVSKELLELAGQIGSDECVLVVVPRGNTVRMNILTPEGSDECASVYLSSVAYAGLRSSLLCTNPEVVDRIDRNLGDLFEE